MADHTRGMSVGAEGWGEAQLCSLLGSSFSISIIFGTTPPPSPMPAHKVGAIPFVE